MSTVTATPCGTPVDGLGEGILWDDAGQGLRWVDIDAGAVHEGVVDAAGTVRRTASTVVDRTVGAVAPGPDRRLLVAGRRRLWVLEADGGRVPGPFVLPDDGDGPAAPVGRLNDGACDPAGRFLVGSLRTSDGREVLRRLEDDGSLTTLDTDLLLSNGLGWSPDGATLYSVDTGRSVVFARDYDPTGSAVGPRREHLRLPGEWPDGLRVDADGNLWLAVFGAGQVRCYGPSGRLVTTVTVAAPNTTCLAFAGPDRDLLVVTTASHELDAARLAEFPDSGRLFVARPGARGLPTTPWNGLGIPRPAARSEV